MDPENRESVEACTPGFRRGEVEVDEGHIHAPTAPRTAAEADEDRPFGYAYDGGGRRSSRPMSKGGYSDTIPYCAGVLALGWQICPELTPAQIKDLLFESAYVHASGARIINPIAFIELVRKQNGNKQSNRRTSEDLSTIILRAVEDGRISFKLTTPDEFKEIAGQPTREWTEDDGEVVFMNYPGFFVCFFGKPETDTPHTLISLSREDKVIDVGQNRPITLRDEGDIDKFGTFWGCSGLDLSRIDLSEKGELLKTMPFDIFTVWPAPEFLPRGYDPEAVMAWGKYPGLGIKQLHDKGITGKGIHVAIIDQPLLADHIEYKDRLVNYTKIQTGSAGPQMHGTAVASLFVGKTCGVAPGALLHFWGQPSWKGDYKYRCTALEQIIEFNKTKEKSEQIRIVSVSKGFSSNEPNLDRWKELLEKARQSGIYVVHCSDMGFGAGCRFLEDSDDPTSYRLCAFYGKNVFEGSGTFFSPIDYRTTAGEEANDAYSFHVRGGLSWGAPYIAGVIALGMQVNPDLRPDQISGLLYNSGWDFQKGKLINPVGFVEEVHTAD